MSNITVKYGFESINTTASSIREALTDRVKAFLGYGDNIVTKINGVIVPLDTPLYDGQVIVLEQKANEKGSK